MKKNIKLHSIGVAVMILIVGNLVFSSKVEASGCKFDRDLDTGVSDGADILCLQKYLNENGFVIASSGVGSPGKETNQYKSLTKDAVIKWQKQNKLSPALGTFGSKSRAKYQELLSGSITKTPAEPVIKTLSSGAVDVSPEALTLRIAELKNQLAGTIIASTDTNNSPITPTTSTATAKHIKEVIKSLQSAENEVENNSDATDYKRALATMVEARANFLLSVISYLDGDMGAVNTLLNSSQSNIKKALDNVGSSDSSSSNSSVSKSDATAKLDKVNTNYSKIKSKVNTADDAGKVVTKSNDLLKQARTILAKVKTDLKNEDYKKVITSATEADDLINAAGKAVGKVAKSATDYLAETKVTLKSVKSDMNAALKNGTEIGSAKLMLSDASSYLSDASDAIDAGNDASAIKLINRAAAKIKSAKGEF